jgi:hypothetical protein
VTRPKDLAARYACHTNDGLTNTIIPHSPQDTGALNRNVRFAGVRPNVLFGFGVKCLFGGSSQERLENFLQNFGNPIRSMASSFHTNITGFSKRIIEFCPGLRPSHLQG